MLLPKLFTTLKGYDRHQFSKDAAAGVIVGVVALPLSIAFAIASGVTPDRGLWTAIVAGALISMLGGSRVQIGGPTGAFVVIVYGIVQRYGIDGLIAATFLAGVMLAAFGLLRFGTAIRYIPRPLIVGFSAGIAVLIATGQLKDALGLRMGAAPPGFVESLRAVGAHVSTMNLQALGITALSILILLLWPRVSARIPAPLVVILVATAIVQFGGLQVETIGSRFGEIHASMPTPRVPHLSLADIRGLLAPAFTIALLGGIESLLSAVVADGMIGGTHRSNMELVAQGIANTASSIFGGIPATGAIARTATNVKNGGRTPVAGIVHAITLLVITLFLGRWAALIPMAALAAILLMVAWHMSEWRVFRAELSSPREDVAVLLVTFLLTVFVDLTVGIEVGMVLAAFLFMKRMADITGVQAMDVHDHEDDDFDTNAAAVEGIPRGVEVYEVNGPLFFGAAAAFKDTLGRIAGKPPVLILRMRKVPVLDATALHTLSDVVRRTRRDGTLVILSGVQDEVRRTIERSTLLDVVGAENICTSFADATAHAKAELERRGAHAVS